jgi:hypothetical protein
MRPSFWARLSEAVRVLRGEFEFENGLRAVPYLPPPGTQNKTLSSLSKESVEDRAQSLPTQTLELLLGFSRKLLLSSVLVSESGAKLSDFLQLYYHGVLV